MQFQKVSVGVGRRENLRTQLELSEEWKVWRTQLQLSWEFCKSPPTRTKPCSSMNGWRNVMDFWVAEKSVFNASYFFLKVKTLNPTNDGFFSGFGFRKGK
ncbi:hypothetical protein TNCV_435951 [Trichonephila clavipes]|nr:hypothetical protein TNCV_435951 [Trichonephila clavipes]